MNDVIKSGNIIKKIRDGKQLEEIALFARNCIFRDGPKDTLVLEILSYLKLFQPTFFEKFEDELIETMGLFFKNPSPDTLQGVVFDMYRQHIKEKYGEDYTPMQASILEQIEDKHHFSFSAPTSTGKSFVFRNLIRSASNDVVVIVPSRALINEYYDRIREIVNVKEVNVLTFVDRINTKFAKRNIFILTPERSRELFKNKSWLNIDLILFDEITRFNLSSITLEYSRINLTRMLEQLVYEFKPMLLEKNLKCELDIPPNIMIKIDANKMQRVFDNLLRNAVNYSFDNGTIHIAVKQDENNLNIKFTNCGNTIPKEKLERIFEQFYRLDTARSSTSGGAGLGLAIAKEIVELHNGTITAESKDETIEFEVILPLL